MPYFSVRAKRKASGNGKIPVKIRPPSSGKTGIRLNAITDRLKITVFTRKRANKAGGKTCRMFLHTLNMKNAAKARARLVSGPANATQTMSFFGFFNRAKFTGTGFAQPKTNGSPDSTSNNGKSTVPIAST